MCQPWIFPGPLWRSVASPGAPLAVSVLYTSLYLHTDTVYICQVHALALSLCGGYCMRTRSMTMVVQVDIAGMRRRSMIIVASDVYAHALRYLLSISHRFAYTYLYTYMCIHRHFS